MLRDRDLLERGAERGVELCRRGEWEKGLGLLSNVLEAARETNASGVELPGVVYSYLGYGVAKHDKKYRDGLVMCRHAVEIEFYEPDNFANLARTCLLVERRKEAMRALRRGLSIHPNHPLLRSLYREMGVRRRPVAPFLSRAHPVNRLLGRLRGRLGSWRSVSPGIPAP